MTHKLAAASAVVAVIFFSLSAAAGSSGFLRAARAHDALLKVGWQRAGRTGGYLAELRRCRRIGPRVVRCVVRDYGPKSLPTDDPTVWTVRMVDGEFVWEDSEFDARLRRGRVVVRAVRRDR